MDILWFIENGATGIPVSESAEYTSIGIRRLADGYLYDWDTKTFLVDGGTSPTIEYEELDLLPGFYKKTVDVAAWKDGSYHAVSYLDTPTVATNRIVEIVIKDGKSFESSSDVSLTTMNTSLTDISDKIYSPPAATLLVQEYYNHEDFDGNGLIYGIDFHISANRPKILDNIPKRGVPMTWEDYLASI
jgi:hypothetical protein